MLQKLLTLYTGESRVHLHYKFLKVTKNSIVITFNDLAVQTFDFQSFEPELHRDDKPSHGGK